MYNGEYSGYPATLVGHETTSEIDVYLDPHLDEDREVLIYSYGREPHCYVENCYIQNKP